MAIVENITDNTDTTTNPTETLDSSTDFESDFH